VAVCHPEVESGHLADCRDHDLRSKWQRRHRDPRRQGAVVGTKWHPARVVIIELSLNTFDDPFFPPRSVGSRDPPAELAVAFEFERVAPRVLLLNVGRLAAVLEVVAVVLSHKRVTQTSKIDPELRELVCEERPAVEQLATVDLPPFVSGAISRVT